MQRDSPSSVGDVRIAQDSVFGIDEAMRRHQASLIEHLSRKNAVRTVVAAHVRRGAPTPHLEEKEGVLGFHNFDIEGTSATVKLSRYPRIFCFIGTNSLCPRQRRELHLRLLIA